MTAPVVPTTAADAIAAQQAAAFAAQQQALRQQLAAVIVALWAGVAAGQVFDSAAAARFVRQLLPISIGAQRAMVALTLAQFNTRLQPPRPITVVPDTVTGGSLRGVNPTEYYARPFSEIKWRLSQGKTIGEALDAGRRRAESIALTDLQLAHTHTARHVITTVSEGPPLAKGKVVGFKRVLGSNPIHCALCILATTQRYHRAELLPIHPGCGCHVEEVYEDDFRAGKHVLDPALAQDIHNVVRRDLGSNYVDAQARGSASGTPYRDILITHEHGEMGPILGVRGQHFTGPAEVQRITHHQRLNPLPQPADDQDLDQLPT